MAFRLLGSTQDQGTEGRPGRIKLKRKDSDMHPDLQAYLWIAVKAATITIVAVDALKLGLYFYRLAQYGV